MPNDDRQFPMHRTAETGPASGKVLCIALMLFIAAPAMAAQGVNCAQPAASAPPPSVSGSAELSEVLVSARSVTRRTSRLGEWLKRLEGQYRYEGHVDVCGNGRAEDLRAVTGKSDCVSLYSSSEERRRSLYCVIDVRWPQVEAADRAPVFGKSRLSPAMVVFNVVPDLPGIQSMQIDSEGIATHSRGSLRGDTLTTIGPCGFASACRRVAHITASAASEEIQMLIDFEVDSRRVMRQVLRLHRETNIQLRRTPFDALTRDELLLVGER